MINKNILVNDSFHSGGLKLLESKGFSLFKGNFGRGSPVPKIDSPKNVLLLSREQKNNILKNKQIFYKSINKNLADMDFFVNFTLDEEFNETIKSRHRDEFNYHSFSEGEKLRIDLAILFTWREIAKLKNSTNTNLLILDEIFDSSLDSSGTDEFMRILHFTMSKENVFVISHKGDTLMDKFPRVMKFEKYKNFTRMAE